VALLARRGVTPRPGPREAGVRCAVRTGVPIVEDGGELLDPFAPWVARRTDGDGVVAACEAAARAAFDPVLDRLRTVCERLLRAEGVDPAALGGTFAVDRDHLVVHLSGPPLPDRTTRAVCDRTHDALRAVPRTFRGVDVGHRST
jgi:hypothetical protein